MYIQRVDLVESHTNMLFVMYGVLYVPCVCVYARVYSLFCARVVRVCSIWGCHYNFTNYRFIRMSIVHQLRFHKHNNTNNKINK